MHIHESWLSKVVGVRGDVFLDVGAHVGTWVDQMHANFNHVFAFDPQPACTAELFKRCAYYGNCTPILCLLGRPTDKVPLQKLHIYNNTEASTVYSNDSEGGPLGYTFVPCLTLDHVIADLQARATRKFSIDFVKIDVEGAELDVLAGATESVLAVRPNILVEIHSEENGELVTDLLLRYGFREPELIRHPRVEPGSPAWKMHYWLWSSH